MRSSWHTQLKNKIFVGKVVTQTEQKKKASTLVNRILGEKHKYTYV